MYLTRMIEGVVGGALRASFQTVGLLLRLFGPPLLLVAVGISQRVLVAVEAWWALTPGRIYLVCIGGWMGLALLLLPGALIRQALFLETLFLLLGGGCLVGLLVASQIAPNWVSVQRELPQHDVSRLHRIHPSMTATADDREEAMNWEELFNRGVVLGRRVREE